MIIMTRECVANKKHVTRSKFKVIDYSLTLFIGYNKSLLYPVHNFVLYGGISKSHGKTSVVCEDHVRDKISSLSCQKVADSITSSKMGNNVAKQVSVLLHSIPEYIRHYLSAYCTI